jgi:hypothetical protein
MAATDLKQYKYNYSALGDFDSIKAELLAYIKKFYPNEYDNFENQQAGGIILDTFSHIGELLSFTQGQYFNQLFIETVTDYQSAYNLAQFFGFNDIGASLPWVTIDATVEVPADNLANIPKLLPGAEIFSGNGSIRYFLTSEIDFNSVLEENWTKFYKNGSLFKVRIPAQGFATSYNLKTYTTTVTPADGANFVKFYEVTLPDLDVQEIFSIEDNNGQTYYEVSHLIQDTILNYKINENDENDNIPYLLFEEKVPFRYIKKNFLSGENIQTKLIFGGIGVGEYQAKLFNINPADLILPADLIGIDGRSSSINKLMNRDYDPENMMLMDQTGIGPSKDDVLTVKYSTGGGNGINTVNPNELKRITKTTWSWPGNEEKTEISSSLLVTNNQPSAGARDKLTLEELKHHTKGQAVSQKRAVTPNDYQAIVMSMPSFLGRPEKVHLTRSNNATVDPFKFYLYLASIDNNGYLYNSVLNPAFVHNIRMYLKKYKGLSDLIVIKGANIINAKIEIDVKVDYGVDLKTASYNVLQTIKSYFSLSKRDFGQWVDVNDLFKYIRDNVDNISSINNFKLVFPTATELDSGRYAQCGLNKLSFNGRLNRHTMPQDSILEIKYPESDIKVHIEALKY